MKHEQKYCRCCGKSTPKISNTKGYRDYCDLECRTKHERKFRAEAFIKRVEDFGFTYLGGYTHNKSPMNVRNNKCEHEFTISQAANIFTNPDYCPTCGNKLKHEKLVARNMAGAKPREYRLVYSEYRKRVNLLTSRTYRTNKSVINPLDLPIGRTDTCENAHHLDHIVPVKYCFERGFTPERCASVENLRVMPALENIVKYSKLTDEAKRIVESWT